MIFEQKKILWLLLCSSLWTTCLSALELKKGDSAEIILPEQPLSVEVLSAEILQDGLKKSLAMYFRKGAPVKFRIGRAAAKYEQLKNDEFMIVVKDNEVSLFGGDDSADPLDVRFRAMTGTLYAVAYFLREHCGMRWLWPGKLGEIVMAKDTLNLKDGEIRRNPQVSVRDSLYSYANLYNAKSKRAFVLWGRLNGLGNSITGGQAGHSDEKILGNRYFESHPEYYALVDGKRRPMSKFSKICYSNDDVARIYTDYILAAPTECVSISPNDGHSWCECPSCLKSNSAGAGTVYDPKKPNASGSVFLFANKIGGELKKRGSSKKITLFAYEDYVLPPKNLDKLEDNIILFLARGINWLNDETEKKNYVDLLDEWSRRADRVVIRDYRNNLGPMIVNPYPAVAYETIQGLYRNIRNFSGISIIGDDTRAFALWGATIHVYNTLLWDRNASQESIMDDYYISGWPASHSAIRAYFKFFETAVDKAVKKHHFPYSAFHTAPNILILLDAFNEENVKSGKDLLVKAMDMAAGPEEKARVEFLKTGLNAVELDRDYYCALVRLASSGEMLLHIPVLPEFRDSDPQESAAEVIRTAEKRKKFLEENLNHEGIPAQAVLRRKNNKEPDLGEIAKLAKTPENIRIVRTPWKFCPDPEKVGFEKGYHQPEYDDNSWDSIFSGRFWEQQGYGAERYGGKDGYNGWAWYRQSFDLKKDASIEDVVLTLGAVDESCIVYVNGRKVMEYHYDPEKDPLGWRKPRSVSIGREIKSSGKTLIAVAVHDSRGMGGLWKHVTLEECKKNLLPLLARWKTRDLSFREAEVTKTKGVRMGVATETVLLDEDRNYFLEFIFRSMNVSAPKKTPKITLTMTDLKTKQKILHAGTSHIELAPGDVRRIARTISGTGGGVRIRLDIHADGDFVIEKLILNEIEKGNEK